MANRTRYSPFDQAMMQRCITLAQQAVGQTAPNPLVGAVIVKDGKIIGEGFHPKTGQPHAEVFALREAGAQSQGATLYVNLEPCNHHGRTPPCSEAVIQAGIAKVVVGMVDPNPQVAGQGLDRLRTAGVEVTVGVDSAACERLNEAFVHRIRHHRPFGILKYAMTLDGKIATTTGHSAWVTGPEARSWVHQLRAQCDAVIVGGNTVRKDNPLLTSHGVSTTNPLRVVMSRTLNLPRQAKLWATEYVSTIVFTQVGSSPEMKTYLQQSGVEVVELDQLTPDAVMDKLYDLGLLCVLWECGGTLASQAIQTGVIQKVFAFVAPKIIGGNGAPSPIGDLGLEQMNKALLLNQPQWQTIGADYLIEGYLSEFQEESS